LSPPADLRLPWDRFASIIYIPQCSTRPILPLLLPLICVVQCRFVSVSLYMRTPTN
jgi:hypothetical protein